MDVLYTRRSGGAIREWSLRFGRDFKVWEVDEVATFFHLLHTHSPQREDEDRVQWDLRKTGAFIICSYY